MTRADQILTETWKDKRYENDLTKLYFDVMRILSECRRTPALENLKTAYSQAMMFLEACVYSKQHLGEYRQFVIPVMDDIEIILFGDPSRFEVADKAHKYGVRIVNVKNRPEIVGGPVILNRIADKIFLVKQWAYEEGLLLPKPIERKYGLDALEDVMEQ